MTGQFVPAVKARRGRGPRTKKQARQAERRIVAARQADRHHQRREWQAK